MERRRRYTAGVCVAIAAFFAATATARADGLPVLGVDAGGTGVTAPDGGPRYVTLEAGKDTVLAQVDPRGGRILASRLLAGAFTIPAVAYDGTAAGLSADGRTLVLIEPRRSFPRAETRFLLVSAGQLRPLARLRLHGDFSFDAISPQGRLMYLIEYNEPTDPTRYLVRAYDVRSRRLLAAPVVDPRERSDKMRGSPLTRTTSSDGRFAYTLYDGAGGNPFVHALDTSRRAARCIDLALLAGSSRLWQLRLSLDRDGRALTVRDGGNAVALVDTQTGRVTTPLSATAQPASGLPRTAVAGVAAAALIVLLGCVGAVVRRRQRLARAREFAT